MIEGQIFGSEVKQTVKYFINDLEADISTHHSVIKPQITFKKTLL